MPTSLVAIGETLRARLDGPWNQPADGTEPEDRRGVKECGLSRRGAGRRAVEPAEAGVRAGLGVARDPAVRLDRRLGARVQGLAAGTERLRDLLAHDLAHGIALVAQQGGSAGAITAPANVLYSMVFESTGIHDMGMQFADGSAPSIPDTIMRRSYGSHREGVETAMVGIQRLAVRAANLVRFAPLLFLLYPVGTANGLTQRAIRRACGGRESASLYHRAKCLQLGVLRLGGFALVVWPGPVQWELCATLGFVLTGGLASVRWVYYKKHLWCCWKLPWPRGGRLSTISASSGISLLVKFPMLRGALLRRLFFSAVQRGAVCDGRGKCYSVVSQTARCVSDRRRDACGVLGVVPVDAGEQQA